mmetsp:Transcript_30351/g.66440  ORF Transcript_30351/g.66440 Transcript_30351/m.66440 type:complete len:819 (+) Transcript_30351:157-2613(+)|eukprot:CAMPEP_0170581280 /NCGR_PEP_ID=MMETSP0224-20130122/6953_1 /TAXON_ID=285029 /ORGANISM="Togula jolla, Strain CCCM 725" /LENGTH=818 /DNA_ID=CAMNT_0010904401 /DNA_START=83 /DNA_END=2539 /DNA_ORIENTATION=-
MSVSFAEVPRTVWKIDLSDRAPNDRSEQQNDGKTCPPSKETEEDIEKVIRGKLLLGGVVSATNDKGTSGVPLLRDPVTLYTTVWLDQAEHLMRQHKLSNSMRRVLAEWEAQKPQKLPIAAWAKEAFERHLKAPNSEPLKELEEVAAKGRAPKGCLDPASFEAERVLLWLVHQEARSLLKERLPLLAGVAAEADLDLVASRLSKASQLLLHDLRQRFLNKLRDVLTSKTMGWELVSCLVSPMPWNEDIAGEALLFHRSPGPNRGTLLAEVACSPCGLVTVDLCGPKADDADRAERDAAEAVKCIQDFLFDFKLRSLVESYQCLPAGYPWPLIDTFLQRRSRTPQSELPSVEHPHAARNLIVRGQVPLTSFSKLFPPRQQRTSGESADFAMPRHDPVGLIEAMASWYGFHSAAGTEGPLLALCHHNHNFARVVLQSASAADFRPAIVAQPSSEEDEPRPQGVRCILFACPRWVTEASTGEAGGLRFDFTAIVVDFAYITPPLLAGEDAWKENEACWAKISARLKSAAEEALTLLDGLVAERLAAWRSFRSVVTRPRGAKPMEVQKALAACRTRIDLCAHPYTAKVLGQLRQLKAMDWDSLGEHLRDNVFHDGCADFRGNLDPDSQSKGDANLRQLIIASKLGVAWSEGNEEEVRYVLLHLTWEKNKDQDREVLVGVSLCASHDLPQTMPARTRPRNPSSRCIYEDELDSDEEVSDAPRSTGSTGVLGGHGCDAGVDVGSGATTANQNVPCGWLGPLLPPLQHYVPPQYQGDCAVSLLACHFMALLGEYVHNYPQYSLAALRPMRLSSGMSAYAALHGFPI